MKEEEDLEKEERDLRTSMKSHGTTMVMAW